MTTSINTDDPKLSLVFVQFKREALESDTQDLETTLKPILKGLRNNVIKPVYVAKLGADSIGASAITSVFITDDLPTTTADFKFYLDQIGLIEQVKIAWMLPHKTTYTATGNDFSLEGWC